MLYGTDCWAIKKHVHKMRMLRWIDYSTKKDRIWNEEISFKIGIGIIDEKMRVKCLKWFNSREQEKKKKKNVEEDLK